MVSLVGGWGRLPVSAWWGSPPFRGGGRCTPGKSGLDIHQSAQVKEAFAEMGG